MAALCVALISFGGCLDRGKTLYEEARKLWLDERYDDAVVKLLIIVDENYGDYVDEANLRLGEIYYLNLDDTSKALNYFDQAGKDSADREIALKAHDYKSEIYLDVLDNHDNAILEYQFIINNFKDRVTEDKYLYRVGEAYFKKGDYEQAAMEFSNMLARFPESALKIDARYHIANLKFITGQSEQALKLFRDLLTIDKKGKYTYDIKLASAICYEDMGRLKTALSKYSELLGLYPEKDLLSRKIISIKKRMSRKVAR